MTVSRSAALQRSRVSATRSQRCTVAAFYPMRAAFPKRVAGDLWYNRSLAAARACLPAGRSPGRAR